jgi:hypothetical protein
MMGAETPWQGRAVVVGVGGDGVVLPVGTDADVGVEDVNIGVGGEGVVIERVFGSPDDDVVVAGAGAGVLNGLLLPTGAVVAVVVVEDSDGRVEVSCQKNDTLAPGGSASVTKETATNVDTDVYWNAVNVPLRLNFKNPSSYNET